MDSGYSWPVAGGKGRNHGSRLKYNDFLRTRKAYRNFELHASFCMMDPSGKGNSGIQFRQADGRVARGDRLSG